MRKLKILIVGLLGLSLVVGIVALNDLRYPAVWDQIRLGMTRAEVYDLIGESGGEWSGWSGMYWHHNGILIRNQLELYIDPTDCVTIISLKHQSSFPTIHDLWIVRSEHRPRRAS